MRSRLDREGALRVLRHLVPGCSRCQEITAVLWWAGEGRRVRGGAAADPGPAIGRVLDEVRRLHAVLLGERAAARQICAGLAGRPAADWGARLRGEARTWGLCELLLAESRAARSGDPSGAEAFARYAVAVAQEIPAGSHPAGLLADLAARAWASLAEARRAGGDLEGAEGALHEAEGHLARGSGERLERARLSGTWAALRCSQGRYRDAEHWLRRALVVYRRTGQADLLGRGFVQLGYVRAGAGDLAGALIALRQGLALADATRDPETALAALCVLDGLSAAAPPVWTGGADLRPLPRNR